MSRAKNGSSTKIGVVWQKSDFCHTTPILVDDPFLALGMTVNFPPWKPFFDFPFRSYSCFRKKIRLTRQKVFPPPIVGFYCTVKALALSARRPFRPARFARGLDNHAKRILLCCDQLHMYISPMFSYFVKFSSRPVWGFFFF